MVRYYIENFHISIPEAFPSQYATCPYVKVFQASGLSVHNPHYIHLPMADLVISPPLVRNLSSTCSLVVCGIMIFIDVFLAYIFTFLCNLNFKFLPPMLSDHPHSPPSPSPSPSLIQKWEKKRRRWKISGLWVHCSCVPRSPAFSFFSLPTQVLRSGIVLLW